MKKKSFVSPSFLKQKARQIKKQKAITQHQALDEAANALGYSNYKNYRNTSESNRRQIVLSKTAFLEQIRSQKEKEIFKKICLTISLLQSFKIPFQDLLDDLKLAQHSKEAMRSICEKSPVREYIELHLLKDFLEDENGEIGDYAPYHIAKDVKLKNILYKFSEDMLYVKGDYSLKLEFGFDHDKDTKDDFFNDREMFGSFELSIDRNKIITIENLEMGHYL